MRISSGEIFMHVRPKAKKPRGRPPHPLTERLVSMSVDDVIEVHNSTGFPVANLIHLPTGHMRRNYPDRKFRIFRTETITKILRVK